MWWFSALAALLIGNVGSENTNIPVVWKKVASGIDSAVSQLRHHFTKTPLGILHGQPTINSARKSQGFRSCGISGFFFPSSPAALIWRIQVLRPSIPLTLSAPGESNSACAISPSTLRAGA